MAGYISSADRWRELSLEWEQLLGLGPPHFRKIEEVKMSDMTSPLGLEQCELFYRLIEKYVAAHVSCSIRIADLKAAFEKIKWPAWLDNLEIATNEHYSAFEALVKGVSLNSHYFGVREPVHFVFDNHSNKSNCLRAWAILKSQGHPKILELLGPKPDFGDSKCIMPLQAADMLAYWARAAVHESSSQTNDISIEFPWSKKTPTPGVHIYFEQAMIERNFRNVVLACSMARYGVPPRAISAVVSP